MRVAVVPALNEERTIGTVVLKAAEVVDQVLVVDDGSTDATAEVAKRAGAEVLPHEGNRGKGAALWTGLREALDRKADVVVTLDGDGQHDPAHLAELVAPIEAGEADVVVGSRDLDGDGASSRSRQVGRAVLDTVTNTVGGLDVADTQSGFRAIRADVLPSILPKESGMGVESEMLLAAQREGHRIVEVQVPDHYPEGVSPSTNPTRHGASVLASILRFVREEHPLAFFGGGGLVALVIGLYLGYQTASHYYATQVFWPGKAMLSMLFLILGSIAILGAMILDALQLQKGPNREVK